MAKLLEEGVKAGLAERFARLRALKTPGADVAQGREWVEAYVRCVHYVVGIQKAAAGKAPAPEAPGEAHGKRHEE